MAPDLQHASLWESLVVKVLSQITFIVMRMVAAAAVVVVVYAAAEKVVVVVLVIVIVAVAVQVEVQQQLQLEALRERRPPWPRQIITPILPTVKILSLGFGSLPAPRYGYATTIMVFFAHLLILEYPDHHQNLISSSLYYPGPLHKISSQSVPNFLSNVVHRQTNKQTNKQTNATKNTRSTQRAQTSLAEADHYSHIAHCKMLSLGCERLPTPLKKKKKKKVLDHYLHHDLGMLPLLRCFFAHLLILQYPDRHQNLISSSLYYSGPVHEISSQSVHNFLSNVHRQTNKLEALRERIPPWPRQIITLILPTVKMLSLGCERLPTPLKKKKKMFWIITCTMIWVCYHYYVVFLLIYSSYNTQITTKI